MGAEVTPIADTDRVNNRRCIVLIILIGLIAHFNSFGGAFLFDDGWTITNNEKVNDITLERLKLGRPIIGYINAINHLADGNNPRGYHLVNLVAHLVAALALFGLVRRTLLLERWPERVRDSSRMLALAIASIWMVHPIQTASVTYIIQRCESMMGMFYLLSMYCFLRGATARQSFGWYIGAICSAVLGNACKEVIVTAPIVIFAFDRVFLAPGFRRFLKNRLWFYAVLTAALGLTFYLWSGKMVVSGGNAVALGFDYQWHGPWEYLYSQTAVIPHYLRLSFWPDLLCFDYQDWPVIRTWRACWLPGAIIGLTVLFSLIGVILRWWIGFAVFAFFAILAPTSSIMPIQDLIFDHRMYLSLAPLVCLVVGVAWRASNWVGDRLGLPSGFVRSVQMVTAVGLVAALSIATMSRNDDYRSRVAIWSDVVKKRPHCVRALTEVASQIYREETKDEALLLARRASELMPNYPDARYYYGIMLFDRNQIDEAAEHFNYASRLNTQSAIYSQKEGICYLAAGYFRWAITAFRETLKRSPNDNWTKLLLALAEQENGDGEAAASIFAELRLDHEKKNDSTWVMALNEARMIAYRDDPADCQKRLAILYAKGSVRITGEKKLEPLDMLAVAYSVSGQFDEAQQAVQKAIALAHAKGDEKAVKALTYRLNRYKQHKTLEFGASR